MIKSIKNYFLRHIDIDPRVKYAILLLALVGLIDTFYLSYSNYLSVPVTCPIVANVNSCDIVTKSDYSTILGIPLAFIGVFFYLTVFAIGLISLIKKHAYVLNILLPLTTLAFLFSLRLVYLQLFVIEYICYYCIVSAALSTALFGISIWIYKKMDIPS